ncbi:Nitrogen fixation protein FixH [Gammaproteobacteria bacterium]
MNDSFSLPWYRQFWPWFLIAIPTTSVMVGTVLLYFSLHAPDSLVIDDYYKAGLSTNQDLARDHMAEQLSLRAELQLGASPGQVQLRLDGNGSDTLAELHLKLVHPTRAGYDVDITLKRGAQGRFVGDLPQAPPPGYWHLLVEPQNRAWRLRGRIHLPQQTHIQLGDHP